MTDLIPRDAVRNVVAKLGQEFLDGGSPTAANVLNLAADRINTIPAIDPAAIREAALREAVKSLRDWQTHLNRHSYKETAITIGMSADVVEALIGEKK